MWVWSKLSGSQWTDAWEERFYGNPNSVISEIKGGKTVRVEVYCKGEKEAVAIQTQFGGSVRELKSQNWAKLSAPKAEPILIRDQLVITQLETKKELAELQKKYPDRHLISIPAEMAFGTGDHPTTSTCLRFLTDAAHEKKDDWSCLDLGTGSGVLAIAAKLLRAGEVRAFDYDPKAVEVALANTKRNKVSGIETFEADVFTWKNRKKFDVLTANLFSTVLVEALPLMAQWIKKDGRLIISGILFEQWPEVLAQAKKCNFLPLEHRKKGKWVTATFDVAK